MRPREPRSTAIDRRMFLQGTAIAGLTAFASPSVQAASAEAPPADGQPKKLLFWDLARFDDWHNVELVQGRAVYRPEATFEDRDSPRDRVIFPSVWKEPSGRWLALYGKTWSPFPLCVLESDDGIGWRPLPVPEAAPVGGKLAPHHVFTLQGGSGSCVYHDPVASDGFPLKIFARQDGDPVYRRALDDPGLVWHAIAAADVAIRFLCEGIVLGSRDGLAWEILPGRWSRDDWFPEDPVFAFYNPRLGRHVMIARPGWGDRRVCWRQSPDLVAWDEPELLFQPDPLDDAAPIGFYTMPVFPYEQGYVGLLWVFHYSNSEPVRGFNQFYGTMDAQVAFSYDGKRFFRGKREPLVALNPIPEHGCAQVRPCSLVETDTEIRIYSESHRYGHGREGAFRQLHQEPLSAMVLHTLRRDGFMFVRPRGDWGRMLSKPFALKAPEITASIDARYGEARFQLTDLKSQPLPGLTFDDCQPIRAVDGTEEPVRWKNGLPDDAMRQPLRLEIKFFGANLYGLRARWQWLDAQAAHMLEDGKPIDHLLEF
ncbi:MAG: hypothetical protein ACYC6Y_17575 [Thermoguttaceae bacterium]